MSSPMVRAILEGRKVQTRRALKRQFLDVLPMNDGLGWIGLIQRGTAEVEPKGEAFRCKFGVPGDELWVKETWRVSRQWDHLPPRDLALDRGMTIMYDAGGSRAHNDNGVYVNDDSYPEALPGWAGKTRVSIHMPRAASRITLRITDVRCERLQEISEEDAKDEGVCSTDLPTKTYQGRADRFHTKLYQDLWDRINGPGAWNDNPFVWALSFEVMK